MGLFVRGFRHSMNALNVAGSYVSSVILPPAEQPPPVGAFPQGGWTATNLPASITSILTQINNLSAQREASRKLRRDFQQNWGHRSWFLPGKLYKRIQLFSDDVIRYSGVQFRDYEKLNKSLATQCRSNGIDFSSIQMKLINDAGTANPPVNQGACQAFNGSILGKYLTRVSADNELLPTQRLWFHERSILECYSLIPVISNPIDATIIAGGKMYQNVFEAINTISVLCINGTNALWNGVRTTVHLGTCLHLTWSQGIPLAGKLTEVWAKVLTEKPAIACVASIGGWPLAQYAIPRVSHYLHRGRRVIEGLSFAYFARHAWLMYSAVSNKNTSIVNSMVMNNITANSTEVVENIIANTSSIIANTSSLAENVALSVASGPSINVTATVVESMVSSSEGYASLGTTLLGVVGIAVVAGSIAYAARTDRGKQITASLWNGCKQTASKIASLEYVQDMAGAAMGVVPVLLFSSATGAGAWGELIGSSLIGVGAANYLRSYWTEKSNP